MSIFVSVASFCDPHLEFTLDGLFSEADNPAGLVVAVVDQGPAGMRERLLAKPYWPRIRYVHLDAADTRGASWARSLAFSLYGGEDYLLQIDSHTLFDRGWDRSLLGSMAVLETRADKPIISTYPAPFEFKADGGVERTIFPDRCAHELEPCRDADLTQESATLTFECRRDLEVDFAEGFHVAAGFLFTRGGFVDEVPYDPFLYFHGEEQSLAIRAYTRGWTIFHPRQALMPLYHLYKTSGEAHLTHHWHPEHETERTVKWPDLHRRAEARLKDLVYNRTLRGAYGLGAARTLEDFARASGIDYIGRRLTRRHAPASSVPATASVASQAEVSRCEPPAPAREAASAPRCEPQARRDTRIACLMGTYGRVSMVAEGLACFLAQTALEQATLLIYNQHPIPLRFEHPRVTVVNEQPEPGPLRHVVKRMFDLAPADADVFQMWHDDDLYLPWHLETATSHFGDSKAWKPAESWTSLNNETFERNYNYFEGSWMFRADYARAAPMDTHPAYLDHPVYEQTCEASLIGMTDLGARASYIYRWGNGIVHNSEFVPGHFGAIGSVEEQTERLRFQRGKSLDLIEDGRLEPADLTLRWRQFLAGTKALMTPEEWERNRRDLVVDIGRASAAAA